MIEGFLLVFRGGKTTVQSFFDQGKNSVKNHSHNHECKGAAYNQRHILDTDALVDDVAQATSSNKSCKDGNTNRGDNCNANTGKDIGKGDRKLYVKKTIKPGHSHATCRFLDTGIHFRKAKIGVLDNRQKGIKQKAKDHSKLAGS